ncbi:hypothetical protein [Mesorhizobium sp. M0802]|uniref:hypothetical protein n=1 Tax=Mesorhizobium sp. M0802 TaxID=2957001 RepID=UPI0033373171
MPHLTLSELSFLWTGEGYRSIEPGLKQSIGIARDGNPSFQRIEVSNLAAESIELAVVCTSAFCGFFLPENRLLLSDGSIRPTSFLIDAFPISQFTVESPIGLAQSDAWFSSVDEVHLARALYRSAVMTDELGSLYIHLKSGTQAGLEPWIKDSILVVPKNKLEVFCSEVLSYPGAAVSLLARDGEVGNMHFLDAPLANSICRLLRSTLSYSSQLHTPDIKLEFETPMSPSDTMFPLKCGFRVALGARCWSVVWEDTSWRPIVNGFIAYPDRER